MLSQSCNFNDMCVYAVHRKGTQQCDAILYFLLLTGGALESPMYGTDSSVPDLMPSANPKSATLQL